MVFETRNLRNKNFLSVTVLLTSTAVIVTVKQQSGVCLSICCLPRALMHLLCHYCSSVMHG